MSEETKELIQKPTTNSRIITSDDSAMATLLDTGKFEHLWRVAKLFAASSFIPEAFRGKPEDCFIGLQMAVQLKMQPFTLFNTMYVIHGRPAFESKMLIALANASGVFKGPIRYSYSGEKDSRACKAYAVLASTGETVEQTVSIEIAKAEGWYDKKDKNGNLISKWRTMPDLMLAYRSASWLIRLYCPEVMYGFTTKEEAEDSIIDITPIKENAAEKLNSDSIFNFDSETQPQNNPITTDNTEESKEISDTELDELIEKAGLKNKAALLTNLYKTISEKPLIEWGKDERTHFADTLKELIERNENRKKAVEAKKEGK